jgi:hypothetical protein
LLLMRKAGSPLAATSAASVAERTSIQIMAGRSGLPSASTATTEQQVVSIAIATTWLEAMPPAASAPRVAWPMERHQSSGFCSAQLGLGNWV